MSRLLKNLNANENDDQIQGAQGARAQGHGGEVRRSC